MSSRHGQVAKFVRFSAIVVLVLAGSAQANEKLQKTASAKSAKKTQAAQAPSVSKELLASFPNIPPSLIERACSPVSNEGQRVGYNCDEGDGTSTRLDLDSDGKLSRLMIRRSDVGEDRPLKTTPKTQQTCLDILENVLPDLQVVFKKKDIEDAGLVRFLGVGFDAKYTRSEVVYHAKWHGEKPKKRDCVVTACNPDAGEMVASIQGRSIAAMYGRSRPAPQERCP